MDHKAIWFSIVLTLIVVFLLTKLSSILSIENADNGILFASSMFFTLTYVNEKDKAK